MTFFSATFHILRFPWHDFQKPIWLWSSLSLHRKLTPAMSNGLTWCHSSAALHMLLCTRQAFWNDLEREFCQVNEIWAFDKCHFTSNLQKVIVTAWPLYLVLVYRSYWTYVRNRTLLSLLVALYNRIKKVGNDKIGILLLFHLSVYFSKCVSFSNIVLK